jgi:hypothetical protein
MRTPARAADKMGCLSDKDARGGADALVVLEDTWDDWVCGAEPRPASSRSACGLLSEGRAVAGGAFRRLEDSL